MNKKATTTGFILLVVVAAGIYLTLSVLKGKIQPQVNLETKVNSSSQQSQISEILFGDAAAKAFVYNNTTIHPSCLDFLWGIDVAESNYVDGKLNECNKSKITPETQQNGLFVVNYQNDSYGNSSGFTGYKVLAKKGNGFFIEAVLNAGGSSIFDTVQWIKIEGDKLIANKDDIVMSGDRCSHSLSGSKQLNKQSVLLNFAITPPEIIELVASTTTLGDQGLEYSAISCFGTANYSYDIAQNKLTLSSVSFHNEPIEDQVGWTDQYQYQGCFNKVYNEYVANKKTNLSLKELNSFVKIFFTRCKVKN